MKTLYKYLYLALLPILLILGGCSDPINQIDESLKYPDSELKKGTIEKTAKLTQEEIDGILFMREEEKLAYDVYVLFYGLYNHKIFENISESEFTHKDAILGLIEYYELRDPAKDKGPGEFENQELQDLYDLLISMGTDLISALEVGVIIEETDLEDITALMEKTEVENILQVYGNLLDGSNNHLEAFNKVLDKLVKKDVKSNGSKKSKS